MATRMTGGCPQEIPIARVDCLHSDLLHGVDVGHVVRISVGHINSCFYLCGVKTVVLAKIFPFTIHIRERRFRLPRQPGGVLSYFVLKKMGSIRNQNTTLQYLM